MTDIKSKSDFKYASWPAIKHLVEMGILFNAFYDTETTDLDKRYAELTQFGGVTTDIAGNILHMVDLRGKISPYTIISPTAWQIQRMRLSDLSKGDPQYILTGKMKQFFRHSSNLHEAPFRDNFLSHCRKGTYDNGTDQHENYYAYPVREADGNISWDRIRIHENLKKFYYFCDQKQEWIKRDIICKANGYNNVKADDQWIWTRAHMACLPNIFITHSPQFGKIRMDMLRAVEAAYPVNRDNINTIKSGKNINPETGEETLSFSMGKVLEANKHFASELRGLLSGVTLPDGSHPDLTQLHGALQDSLALAGLTHYMRETSPDVLREMEMNMQWKAVVENLTAEQGVLGTHPIYAYIDKSFPFVTGMMITLIGTDQYRNQPKLALVYNLGRDPETFRYNGKPLTELTPAEHSTLIHESAKNQNGIYKVIHTHHIPRVLPAEMGFTSGFNNGLDKDILVERAKYLGQPGLQEKQMAGLRLAYPRLGGPEALELPQAEEELFTFTTLELYNASVFENAQAHLVKNKIEMKAAVSRSDIMTLSRLWNEAIEPDDDIILNTYKSDNRKQELADVEKFMRKIKTINKKLKDKNGPELPEPTGDVIDKKTAFLFKIKLLFYARNNFACGELKDIGHHFWLEDGNGHRIADTEIAEWPQWRIDESFKNPDFKVRHEQIHHSVQRIDRIIESLGYAHILDPEIREQLDALKTLRHNGLPNNGYGDRWYTRAKAERDEQSILNNEMNRERVRAIDKRAPGQWQNLMSKSHDAQASLAEWRAYFNQLPIYEWTPARLESVGIDPETKRPLLNIDYEVDVKNLTPVIVPDRYLERPPRDPVSGRAVWMFPHTKTFNVASMHKDLILRAHGTAKYYHLRKPVIIDIKKSGQSGDLMKIANTRYSDSGMEFPPEKKLICVTGEGPYPLHGARAANMNMQSIILPKRSFEGFCNHKLASYKAPLQGFIIYDDHLHAQKGPVRLLEKDEEGHLTGWEVPTQIVNARRLSMAEISKHPQDFESYGFCTPDAAYDHMAGLFAEFNRDPRLEENKLWVIDVIPVNPRDPKNGIFYFNPGANIVTSVKNPAPFAYAAAKPQAETLDLDS